MHVVQKIKLQFLVNLIYMKHICILPLYIVITCEPMMQFYLSFDILVLRNTDETLLK